MVPIGETTTGELHYKAQVATLGGADFYQYPDDGDYYVLDVTYRAAFGSVAGALFTFSLVATFVWGGLAVALRTMLGTDEDVDLTQPETAEAKDAAIENDGHED